MADGYTMRAMGSVDWRLEILKLAVPAAIIVAGWFAAHLLTRRREDRTRRQETVLRMRERQIEELYGPLLSLIEQVFGVWTVREKLLKAAAVAEPAALTDDQIAVVRSFVWREYFLPLHREIRTLLKTKQHLIEGGQVPESFDRYLQHSTQEEFQQLLWEQHRIGTTFLRGTRWPKDLYTDVQAGLAAVRAKHELALRQVELGTRGGVYERTRVPGPPSRNTSVARVEAGAD